MAFTLLHVSDSHLSPSTPEATSNWSAVVAHAAGSDARAVVHTGDISADGATTRSDLEFAAEQLGRLDRNWWCVPGNHDVGDVDPGTVQWPMTDVARRRYLDVFGSDRWVQEIDGWVLVGFDSQLLASEHPDAMSCAEWLGATIADAGDAPVGLFFHRPFDGVDGESAPVMLMQPTARRRLAVAMAGGNVSLMASGHIHQWRNVADDDLRRVWAPSTWVSLPDEMQPLIGTKTTGVVELRFDRADVSATLVQPSGLVDHEMAAVASPY